MNGNLRFLTWIDRLAVDDVLTRVVPELVILDALPGDERVRDRDAAIDDQHEREEAEHRAEGSRRIHAREPSSAEICGCRD
jgi:hypothetical protein